MGNLASRHTLTSWIFLVFLGLQFIPFIFVELINLRNFGEGPFDFSMIGLFFAIPQLAALVALLFRKKWAFWLAVIVYILPFIIGVTGFLPDSFLPTRIISEELPIRILGNLELIGPLRLEEIIIMIATVVFGFFTYRDLFEKKVAPPV